MSFRNMLCIGAAVILLGAALTVHADVPQLINYQGVLLDGSATPITIPTTVEFRIWDMSGGGTELWMESQSVTPDAAGRFKVLLGSVIPIPDAALAEAGAYLGITISPDPEMIPRQQIVSVGYAYRVGTVDGSDGGVISGDISVSGGELNLDHSTASAGNILKGGDPFIHNYGVNNTFIGLNAGNFTMTGNDNTASGSGALGENTTGYGNTASGWKALFSNTTGYRNTASGVEALLSNTSGFDNTASGYDALFSNTTGYWNTASGCWALFSNTTGRENTASGETALKNNTTGSSNTASGSSALYNNNTGFDNTASGWKALFSNTTGSRNTGLGNSTNVSAGDLTNATAIGYGATVNASNKIRLGNIAVTVIKGQVAYTFTSDKNEKENFRSVDGDEVLRRITEMELSSWNYKGHDPARFRHYGPVAQEFFAAFGQDDVGTIGTPTTINSGDMAGILMIAVQTLEKRTAEVETIKAQNEELHKKTQKIEKLEAQMAEMQAMMQQLLAAQQ